MTSPLITPTDRVHAAKAARARSSRDKGVYPVTVGGLVVGEVRKVTRKTARGSVVEWAAFLADGTAVSSLSGLDGPVQNFSLRADAVEALGRTDAGAQAYRDAALDGAFGTAESRRVHTEGEAFLAQQEADERAARDQAVDEALTEASFRPVVEDGVLAIYAIEEFTERATAILTPLGYTLGEFVFDGKVLPGYHAVRPITAEEREAQEVEVVRQENEAERIANRKDHAHFLRVLRNVPPRIGEDGIIVLTTGKFVPGDEANLAGAWALIERPELDVKHRYGTALLLLDDRQTAWRLTYGDYDLGFEQALAFLHQR